MLYRKIPKLSPGAFIFQRPFLRGLFLEELIFRGAHLRREFCVSKLIGLANLIVGRKFTVFALFYFVFEVNFKVQGPPGGGLYLERRFNGGFFALRVWGLTFGGAYTHGGAYFRNFTVAHE